MAAINADKEDIMITVVVAGKREIGKSTLINNLLRIEKKAEIGKSTKPVTTEVSLYSDTQHIEKRNVELKVVDVPGLGIQQQSDDRRHDIMADIIAKTNKEADILLYCVSMNIGCQIDDTDVAILTLLRMVFGKDLFQHCILVYTFANNLKGNEIKERTEGSADNFQGALRKAGIPDIKVLQARSTDPVEDYKGILGIPAGCERDNPQTLRNWRHTLLQEMVKKVDAPYTSYEMNVKGYKKAMLMKYLHITGIMDRMEEKKLKDGVGPTMHLERANTKQKVKEKLKKKEK